MSATRVRTYITEDDIFVKDKYLVILKHTIKAHCHVCHRWSRIGHKNEFTYISSIAPEHLIEANNRYYIIPAFRFFDATMHVDCREMFKLCPPL